MDDIGNYLRLLRLTCFDTSIRYLLNSSPVLLTPPRESDLHFPTHHGEGLNGGFGLNPKPYTGLGIIKSLNPPLGLEGLRTTTLHACPSIQKILSWVVPQKSQETQRNKTPSFIQGSSGCLGNVGCRQRRDLSVYPR